MRSMRVRKQLKPCPVCKADLMEFLRSAQVNRDMAEVVAKLVESVAKAKAEAKAQEATDGGDADDAPADEDEDVEDAAAPAPAPADVDPSSSDVSARGVREPALATHQVEAFSPASPQPAPVAKPAGMCCVVPGRRGS